MDSIHRYNNQSMVVRRGDHTYYGVRAVIGGRNNNLLFITYYYDNISVFNLNTFKFIKHFHLPTNNCIYHHCFVSKSENEQEREMMKTNEKNKQNQMLLIRAIKK
ncbi:hypothetical protein RFI_02477 [Reticulomyxa filosa]|uniref:Uncharacterized protein n=1 Tax=Reticulomyxa filosa TaxID=46433 RepID=X6P923_RETFI|nr:hypothetical protein RFI_02477 [Reticulomyxa filosa]|eukprot:ETO34613.1 hypothetical protein RFI_02477 [Reticulomyxa filosa]